MEEFTNENGKCYVLKRRGDTALIFLSYNDITPYVVPAIHKQGESGWYAGNYCRTIEEALSVFKGAAK